MWFNSETRATTRGKGTAVELEAEKFLQKKGLRKVTRPKSTAQVLKQSPTRNNGASAGLPCITSRSITETASLTAALM